MKKNNAPEKMEFRKTRRLTLDGFPMEKMEFRKTRRLTLDGFPIYTVKEKAGVFVWCAGVLSACFVNGRPATGREASSRHIDELLNPVIPPDYCTQNSGECSSCSLVNYGRDCMNNPINWGSG